MGQQFFNKHWILIVTFYFVTALVHGQQNNPVSVFTNVQAPYSPYISDYFSPASTKWDTKIVFNDFSEPSWDVKLKITIESNKVRIQSRPEFIPTPIHVFPGVPYTVTGADLSQYFQYNNLYVQGLSPADLSANGRFPEGFYSFCIEVLDYKTGTPISQKACSNFWIQLNDEPITISPICGAIVKPNPSQVIPFQWHQSNMVSPNSMGTEYQLKLYEVTDPNINPLYAIQNNKVLKVFESEFMNQNTFIYDMTAPVLDVGKKYVYTVQGRDIEGKDVFKNKGVSQPCWFYYGYPVGGFIGIQQPLNSGSYGFNDPAYFKWSSPTNLIPGQTFYYQLKIVKLDSLQNPEDAILSNPTWHEENTITTSKTGSFEVLLNKKLEAQTDYAWQVLAFTDGQLIAQSNVSKFYGPPIIDQFNAGSHIVQVKTTFNRDLTHLSGEGIVTLSKDGSKTQRVSFTDLRILNVAGRFALDYGTITAFLSDTSLIELTPAEQRNQSAYFHPTKLKLDKNNLELYGHVTWAFPHAVTSYQKAYVVSTYDWINFDKLTLSGHAVLNPNNQFTLADPYGFKLNLNTISDFLIDENKYNLRFTGDFIVPEIVRGTDITQSNVRIPFTDVKQLFYIETKDIKLSNNVLPLQNSNLVMAPTSYIIDLSDKESPLKLNDNLLWKGVYFPSFRIDFNIDADKFGQLKFKQLIPVNYQLTSTDNYKGWIGADGLNLFITRKFTTSDIATYNKFPASLRLLTLDIEKSSIRNSDLTGSILIPFISTTKKHSFTNPISNNGFEPGYLDSLDNYSFSFNKEGAEQLINITVTRAVFADRERLDMTLDLDWPALNASTKSLTGFKAWGNYDIGFLRPNGTMTLSTLIDGKLTDFPVAFDAIGAGNSNGAYAFGLTGKAVIAEDVSGAEGAPAVNIYSTVPNALLPNDPYVPQSDSAIVAENTINTSASSFEDNVEIIKNDISNKLNQSNVTVEEDRPLQLDNLVAESGRETGESFIESKPAQSRDTSWASFKFEIDQQKLINDAVQAATLLLASPLTENITKAVGEKMEVFTAKVVKLRDSINVKIDRQVQKVVDSLALKIAKKLKKDDFDPTDQVLAIGDSVSRKVSIQLRRNVSRSIDNNILNPTNSFLDSAISGNANLFVELQIQMAMTDVVNGQFSFKNILNNLADGLPVLIHGVGEDAFALINMDRLQNRMYSIGRDAMGGVKVSEIDQLLIRAIDAEVSYLVSRALSNKASDVVNNLANKVLNQEGGVDASAGIGVKMNFAGLGRNLKEGRVDKIVRLDAVSVALKTKFVSFGGLIRYTPNDVTYGNIWKGAVALTVNMPKKFTLEGLYISGRKENTDYWFCQISGTDDKNKGKPGEAMDKTAKPLKEPVSFGPVKLVGVSGRLYHHMKNEPGRPIVPDMNTNYGAGVNFVFFDSQNNGKALRLAIGAGVEIKQDGNYVIEFDGDLQAGSKNPQVMVADLNCVGGGGVSIRYNSAEDHFLGKGWIVVKNKAVCAKGNITVETKPGYWMVQVGTRQDMIMVTPACAGWGGAGWIGVNPTVANAGLGLSYSLYQSIGFKVAGVGGSIDISAGVAAGIQAVIQYQPSIKLMEAGVWVELWASLGVSYSTKIKSGHINLVSIYCSGDLIMRFEPAPTKLSGTVHGRIEVLCFGVGFDAGFEKTLGSADTKDTTSERN